MTISGDYINLGNPTNVRHDELAPSDAKVTHADHPLRRGHEPQDATAKTSQIPARPAGAFAERSDELSESVRAAPGSGPPIAQVPAPPAAMETAVAPQPGPDGVSPVMPTPPIFDSHAQTVRDPDMEMGGELTCHRDPFSGGSGMHSVSVLIGTLAGGSALGALGGWLGALIGGALGMAVGASVGCILGCIAGGYAGKRVAERVSPTTEDHYWRQHFACRPYVPQGAPYALWEPAYTYGIEMRERLLNLTWEEAEPAIRDGWERHPHAPDMTWPRARPAIQDAWDHLTPEPGEQDVPLQEKDRDE